MLVYTIPEFAKAIRTDKNNVYTLCQLGIIKTLSFGKSGKTISIYEAERFLKENAGKDFSEIVSEQKKRKQVIEDSTNVFEMRRG